MTEKMYRNIIFYGLAGIMVISPIVRGAVSLRSFAVIELTIFTLLFLWMWRMSSMRETKFERTVLDKPILCLVVLSLISVLFSVYKHASIVSFIGLLAVVGVYYLVANNFNKTMVLNFIYMLIAMASILALFGLGQYFAGLDHSWWVPGDMLASTYVNHNHFAGYLELIIPITAGLLISSDRIVWNKLVLAIAGLIMVVAFIFTQSRSGWTCLAVSLLVMNAVLIRRKVLKKETLVVLFLIMLFAVIYILAGYDAVTERFLTFFEDINAEEIMGVRVKVWQGSLNMIKHHPVIGTGIGTFVWAFPGHRPGGLGVRAYYAHNDYLHGVAEMGLVVVPIILWMIVSFLKNGFGYDPNRKSRLIFVGKRQKIDLDLMEGIMLGGTAGILSLCLHALVDFNFQIPANMLVISALAGIIMVVGKERKK